MKKASGNYSALHLSTRIREYLTYKAWQSGILVIDINAKGLHENCAVCGANIVSVDKKTQECTCEARTQNQQVSEHRKKYSEKMPDAVSEKTEKPVKLQDKKMENIRYYSVVL